MIKKSATIFGGMVGVFAVLFVTGAMFFSAPTQAYSLSVSAPTNTTISPQNGQTATATAAIVVQTDCRAGYVLQIQGPTDTNLYLDGGVANNQAGKFVSPVDSSNPLNSQPNTYGYSLLSNSPATKFLPLTNQLTTLKDLSDTASPTQDINDTTNLYWGAYAGAELAAGTYKMASSGAADYIVTAAPTCINYTVNFDKNSATATGTMKPQPISVNIPTKLNPNQFTNTSAFLGWNTKPDGTGTAYANEEEVLDLAPAEQSITLYAQWTEPTPLEQISTMQEMTSGICSATPVGTEAVLEDTRDGKTYSVAKLKDGNCWMTENLDHDIDATKTYTPADTDISSNWTPDVSTINIQGLNVGESVSGWVGAFGDNGLASADPGEVYWDGSTNRHSRIGNYYNWTAALAVNDSSAYSNGTETDPSQNPQTSICPKGWRLPIIANEITGHVDEFKELNRLYNNGLNSTDSGLIASPLYFARGGAIDQSSELQGVGDAGSYWSSTAGGPMYVFNTAYYFHHNAGGSDSYSSNIAYGYNIRCVARQSYTVSFDSNGGSGEMADQIIYTGIATKLDANTFTNTESFVGWNTKPDGSGTSYTDEQEVTDLAAAGETITLYAQWETINPLEQIGLMQEMTPDICDAASIGDTATLKDIRDNKTYQVTKLADNNCWMTQNLMLGNGEGGTSIELTDIDTDLVTGTTFTLPAHTPGAWASSNTDADGANSAKMYNNGNIWLDPTSAGSNSTIKNADTPDNPSKYIGNYYNWYTATAGTGLYNTNTDAVSSICPKGWRLPIGGTTNNEFQALASALGASGNAAGSWIMQSSPNYFALSGQYNYSGGGQISYLGARGFWWSSTPDSVSTYRASNLILTATSFNANQGTAKAQGLSVRCVAR